MEQPARRPIVIKIGGSTLGTHDTTIADCAAIHQSGRPMIVVHGGGKAITDWLSKIGVPTRFVNGLRVTDAASLDVVVAVLGGLVNTQLVAELQKAGAPAIGLTGADGMMIRCLPADPEFGYVGDIAELDPGPIEALITASYLPVIAPIGVDQAGQLYNINADTVAGALARAVRAEQLVFLTDVSGVLDGDGRRIDWIDQALAAQLKQYQVIAGGMIPKVDACLISGARAVIADGRTTGALRQIIASDQPDGTVIVGSP